MEDRYGDLFFEQSKYRRHQLPQHSLDWDRKPEVYKAYPDSEIVALPKPGAIQSGSLFDLLRERESIRSYSSTPLTVEQVGCLLWAATGIRVWAAGFSFRTAPSAGALYPIETYVAINRVSDVASGLYHYNIRYHQLELLQLGGFGERVAHAALDQGMCADAGMVVLWTGVFARSKWKYGQRAYRYVFLDCGHIAENLALAATALGLGSCQIAALYDEEVNRLLGVDGVEESVLYLSSVGVVEE